MQGCVFCGIVSGIIPAEKIFENDKVVSFLDINPMKKGHSIVISKKHTEGLHDSPHHVLSDIMQSLPTIALAVKTATGAEGVNILQNNGEAAGMTIRHLHFHVIPRHVDDGLKLWPHKPYSGGEKESLARLIRDRIRDRPKEI